MDKNVEQSRSFNEKVALRRLYYSHPSVVLKNPYQRINEDNQQRRKSALVKTSSLLQSKEQEYATIKRTATYGADSKVKGLNESYLRVNSCNGTRDEICMLTGLQNSLMKNIARNGVSSAPVGKARRDNHYLISKNRKPAMITAMHISTYNMNKEKQSAGSPSVQRQRLFLNENSHELNEGIRGKNSRTETDAFMFQQWGVRKSKKHGQLKYSDECQTHSEGWSQSVRVFNYKSTMADVKYKSIPALSRETPLPPYPSPIFGKSTQYGDEKQTSEQDSKDEGDEFGMKREKGYKFEIVITPPSDDLISKNEDIDAHDVVDLKSLSPTPNENVYVDFEPLPTKSFIQGAIPMNATETMQVKIRTGSRASIVLEDILEATDEDESEHTKL